jgi:hypothetical protein
VLPLPVGMLKIVPLQAQYLPKEKRITLYAVRGVHSLYLLEVCAVPTHVQAQACPLRMRARALRDANYKWHTGPATIFPEVERLLTADVPEEPPHHYWHEIPLTRLLLGKFWVGHITRWRNAVPPQ